MVPVLYEFCWNYTFLYFSYYCGNTKYLGIFVVCLFKGNTKWVSCLTWFKKKSYSFWKSTCNSIFPIFKCFKMSHKQFKAMQLKLLQINTAEQTEEQGLLCRYSTDTITFSGECSFGIRITSFEPIEGRRWDRERRI